MKPESLRKLSVISHKSEQIVTNRQPGYMPVMEPLGFEPRTDRV